MQKTVNSKQYLRGAKCPVHCPLSTACSGFTLIEAMVAVTVITLAVAGPLVTASRAVVASQIAHDQLIASYLAQEGIEYVRAMRDDEYLRVHTQTNASTLAWSDFVTGDPATYAGSVRDCRSTACILDPSRTMGTGSGLALCQVGICALAPLYLDSNGYNQQGSGSATIFTRTVQAFDVAGGNEERIVSKVTWTSHGYPYAITVTDHLTPWQ